MNDNLKALCKALRSGDYPQSTGSLQDKQGFCCLGVGVIVAEEVTGKKFPRWPENDKVLIGGYWDGERKILQEFYGVPSEGGAFYYTEELEKALSAKEITIDPETLFDEDSEGRRHGSIANLNDNNVPFPEIATVIEEVDKLGLWKKED